MNFYHVDERAAFTFFLSKQEKCQVQPTLVSDGSDMPTVDLLLLLRWSSKKEERKRSCRSYIYLEDDIGLGCAKWLTHPLITLFQWLFHVMRADARRTTALFYFRSNTRLYSLGSHAQQQPMLTYYSPNRRRQKITIFNDRRARRSPSFLAYGLNNASRNTLSPPTTRFVYYYLPFLSHGNKVYGSQRSADAVSIYREKHVVTFGLDIYFQGRFYPVDWSL